jgi:predicted alpha/beta-fold hydrolase
MPIITHQGFTPPFFHWGGHLQTILPSIQRKISTVHYTRERLTTPDNDFLDIDWSMTNSEVKSKKLVVLLHGLEGSSDRPYIKGAMAYFNAAGWDGVGYNCRTCSGELNRLHRFYHHADSADLHFVMQKILEKDYDTIVLMGFSMGGNILIKYLGEMAEKVSPKIRCGIAVSSPYDLKGCAMEIEKFGKQFYNKKFVEKMIQKALQKAALMPDFPVSVADLKKVRTCRDFDKLVTVPLHGFASPDDFYTQGSIYTHIDHVKIPVLLLSAQNDPILTPACFPHEKAKKSDTFFLETTKIGGHVGFEIAGSAVTYAEIAALKFANTCMIR